MRADAVLGNDGATMIAILTLFLGTAFGWFCAKRHTSARNDDLQEEIDELQVELAKANDTIRIVHP
jgi:positive regulator of sigma E activity